MNDKRSALDALSAAEKAAVLDGAKPLPPVTPLRSELANALQPVKRG